MVEARARSRGGKESICSLLAGHGLYPQTISRSRSGSGGGLCTRPLTEISPMRGASSSRGIHGNSTGSAERVFVSVDLPEGGFDQNLPMKMPHTALFNRPILLPRLVSLSFPTCLIVNPSWPNLDESTPPTCGYDG